MAQAGYHVAKEETLVFEYRRLMQQEFEKEIFGQRWQVETVFSMIKRNQG
jgi:hypothetical protein